MYNIEIEILCCIPLILSRCRQMQMILMGGNDVGAAILPFASTLQSQSKRTQPEVLVSDGTTATTGGGDCVIADVTTP